MSHVQTAWDFFRQQRIQELFSEGLVHVDLMSKRRTGCPFVPSGIIE
jgi:hypothetical protein